METFYFTLGIITALLVVGGVVILLVWRKSEKTSNDLGYVQELISSSNNRVDREIESLNRELDTEINHVMLEVEEKIKSINTDISEIYKTIDSRHDKLESRLLKIFEDGCKPAQKN